MRIYLLTHERELNRASNTGAIALNQYPNLVERVIWERLSPNNTLTTLIENNTALLLYSATEPALVHGQCTELAAAEIESPPIYNYDNFIIIDSTWQEARKIFNRSPYLQTAARTTIQTKSGSAYTLRRNQINGGLCTIECVIEVLRLKDEHGIALQLEKQFMQFNG